MLAIWGCGVIGLVAAPGHLVPGQEKFERLEKFRPSGLPTCGVMIYIIYTPYNIYHWWQIAHCDAGGILCDDDDEEDDGCIDDLDRSSSTCCPSLRLRAIPNCPQNPRNWLLRPSVHHQGYIQQGYTKAIIS
jgi:hypothetical protein